MKLGWSLKGCCREGVCVCVCQHQPSKIPQTFAFTTARPHKHPFLHPPFIVTNTLTVAPKPQTPNPKP